MTTVFNQGNIGKQVNADRIDELLIEESASASADVAAKLTQRQKEQMVKFAETLEVSRSKFIRDAISLYMAIVPMALSHGMTPGNFADQAVRAYSVVLSQRKKLAKKLIYSDGNDGA